MSEMATETALYLVGVARPGTLAGFDHPGIEVDGARARVEAVEAAGRAFDALVIDVPADVFTGEGAESRLQDVEWLRPRAERHEQIVREARSRASLMPVGFGGVFSGTGALGEALAERIEAISEFLDDTDNCDEWSLKAWVSRAEAIERAKRAIEREQQANAGSGAAYLRARRLEGEAETYAEEHALGLIEGLIDDLGSTITDATERRATVLNDDPDSWLVAHVALLINRDTRAAFDAKLDELAESLEQEGLRLELSGPWSPYSFCPSLADDE